MKSKHRRASRGALATLIIMSLVIALVGTAAGAPPTKIGVIIGFNSAPGNSGDALIESLGGTINSRYNLIPARAATVPAAAIAGLLANPNVAYVEEDGFAIYHTDDGVGKLQWVVNRVDAEEVWIAYTGAGVRVANLDTGIDADHPDLNANVL